MMWVARNTGSKDLTDQNKCTFAHNAQALRGHPLLRPGNELAVWDIEDLITLGRRRRGTGVDHHGSVARDAWTGQPALTPCSLQADARLDGVLKVAPTLLRAP